MSQTIFYCIGDSHASVFTGNEGMIENYPEPHEDNHHMFKGFRIGAPTAYNFHDNKMEEVKQILESHGVDKEKDYVVLVAGEIDCRCHLVKQYKIQQKDPIEIIEECVDKFLRAHSEVLSWGYRVGAWNAVPPSTYHHPDDPEDCWSHVGSFDERDHVTKIFNKTLKQKCELMGMPFFTIYDQLLQSLEHEKKSSPYYRDEIHLHPRALPLIEEEFKRIS